MHSIILAAVAVLAVVIILAVWRRSPAARRTAYTLGAAGVLCAGGAAYLWGRRADGGFRGGAEGDPDAPTVLFHGEDIPDTLIPALKKITKGPLDLPRTLEEIPEGPSFRDVRYKVQPVLHYGQRKLLLAEVGFLTRYGHLADEVVYAGAAPGVHIPLLAHLFPKHRFTLYDIHKFVLASHPETHDRIETRQRYFTDEDAKALKGKKVLFISDIRTGGTPAEAGDKTPTDMELQAGWVRMAEPAASSLKFRLPWSPGATEYFAGELRLQPWAPVGTNETRLEFEGVPPLKQWDHEEYDKQLNYLNTGMRQWGFFKNKLPADVPGVDHCFSCALEGAIWEEYLKGAGGSSPASAAKKTAAAAKKTTAAAKKKTAAEKEGAAETTLTSVSALMNAATEALRQKLDLPPHGVDPATPMIDKREKLIAECEDKKFWCFPQMRRKNRGRKFYEKREKNMVSPEEKA